MKSELDDVFPMLDINYSKRETQENNWEEIAAKLGGLTGEDCFHY